MAENPKEEEKIKITQDQIDKCLEVLQSLNSDTNQIFEIPKEKRVALIMAAGRFSGPEKEEFSRRKKSAKKSSTTQAKRKR